MAVYYTLAAIYGYAVWRENLSFYQKKTAPPNLPIGEERED
jgi:hypothetical protein